MKPTTPDRIRNVALISHGGAGKTSLAEAMLLDAGAIQRLGSVDAGTTVLDWDPDEQKRNQSINLGIASMERGIRWIPAYRVEAKGTPVKEAKLELEAMIINELTDLKNSEVYFVVGVPHFLFQESMSPLSMNSAFAGVSNYFAAGAGAMMIENGVASIRSMTSAP